MKKRMILLFLLFATAFAVQAQTQLVLFRGDKIINRYGYGDDFVYKRKNAKKYKRTFVTDVREFSVITYNDTVPFNDIDRLSLKGVPHKRFSTISKVLITAGIAYFALDQINNILVRGNKPDLYPQVWRPSLVAVSLGVVLTFAHSNSIKIRHPARLVSAPYGSRFYKPE